MFLLTKSRNSFRPSIYSTFLLVIETYFFAPLFAFSDIALNHMMQSTPHPNNWLQQSSKFTTSNVSAPKTQGEGNQTPTREVALEDNKTKSSLFNAEVRSPTAVSMLFFDYSGTYSIVQQGIYLTAA